MPPGSDSEPESNVSEPEELMGDSQRWCAGSGGTGNPTPPLPPDAPPHADLWRLGPFVLMTLIQVCVMAIVMPYLLKDRGARALGALVAHGAEGLGAWCPIILPMVVLLLLVPSLLPQANRPLGAARGRPPDLLHLWSKLDFNPIFTSFASTTRRSRATATPPRSRTPRTPRLPALAEHAPPWLYTFFALLWLAHGRAELYEYASIVVGGITWPNWRRDVY